MLAFVTRRWPWLLVAVLLVAGGAAAFKIKQDQQAKKDAESAKPVVDIPYAAVANGKADVEGGVIEVAARRGGIIREVFVQEGDSVVKGQILARQEDEEQRLAVERSRAELAQVQAQVVALDVALATARRENARYTSLAASNYVAGQKIDQTRDAILNAQASLTAQRAAVATTAARVREAEYNLELTVIRAPADGRILRRNANPGSGASTLNVSTLFNLEPKAPRIVRAEIAERALPVVAVGQQVEIVPEADITKVFTGKVIRRAGVFGARKLQSDDPSERSDERVVEVVVSAEGAPLLIGQRVLVKFLKPGRTAGTSRPAAP
jgi:HlyD family secretion protein